MTDLQKAKLLWRSRRGMLELDLLLQSFMNRCYDTLSAEQREIYERLLEESDPDLYAWLMGYVEAPSLEFRELIALFRVHEKT